MKAYLDSEDSYYRYNEQSIKEELIKSKTKKDYPGIGAVIFTFTAISIVTALSIYTAWQIAFGQPVEFKTYTNNDLNFSIQHPANWKVEDGDDYPDGAFFTIRENKDKEIDSLPASLFDSFFSVSVEEPESHLDTNTMTLQNTSLQERVQQELDRISFNPSKHTLIRQNEVTVGGDAGWKIEYTRNDTIERYVFLILTIADGKFYVLRYVEDPLKVPETLPLVNKMVESFQVGVTK